MKKTKLLLLILCATAWSVQAQQTTPYIAKVFEYKPAPGQFVNELPAYKDGDTKIDMIRKVEECITGDAGFDVSLGAYGGYIIFGFDSPITNIAGEYDFKILGNAFSNITGVSSEPGIVMVSYDANGNGEPDDEWYELAGSEYNSPSTVHRYEIVYHKPAADHMPTPDPDDASISDNTYISWMDNQEKTGYVMKNTFHSQSYWPEWIDDETLTFEGARLADNYTINGANYVFHPYAWGYADNVPNDKEGSNFNIEWAVDGEGNLIDLDEIHFVKVYTALNQYCGRTGESSTEITGAVNLHWTPSNGISYIDKQDVFLLSSQVKDCLLLTSNASTNLALYDLQGRWVQSAFLSPGENRIDCSALLPGIYILSTPNFRAKFIKL